MIVQLETLLNKLEYILKYKKKNMETMEMEKIIRIMKMVVS